MSDEFELEPPISGPDKEANEAKLQAKLQSYAAALEQEWTDGVKYAEGELSPVEIRDKTKELLTQAVPKAVARLTYLVQHGANENVQLKAATFIIERAIGKESSLVGDPMEALLNSLRTPAVDD